METQIDPDYDTVLVYKGYGFTVYENYDPELDHRWYTVNVPSPATPNIITLAMSWFDQEVHEVSDCEYEDGGLWLDLVAR